MRARSGLTGRGEVSEVIGLFSRAEGCWTFDARDRMPRPSRAIAHYPVDNPPTAMRSPSRASGFVHRRIGDNGAPDWERTPSTSPAPDKPQLQADEPRLRNDWGLPTRF
jgi:hypothetical protein